jgi:DtxR family Mn-dependent transcriptional regulator
VVATHALTERLEVTPGAASTMMRKLAALGLVDLEPYRGVTLTPLGEQRALEILRHHRLLELFLVDELGVPWDRVHDEADRLEHAISEDLEALIAEKLGHPTLDPHGDPIPTVDLEIDEGETEALEGLQPGTQGRFVRISDSNGEMLRYLAERDIAPGEPFEVVDRQPFGGALIVRFGEREHALPAGLAAAMRVEAT